MVAPPLGNMKQGREEGSYVTLTHHLLSTYLLHAAMQNALVPQVELDRIRIRLGRFSNRMCKRTWKPLPLNVRIGRNPKTHWIWVSINVWKYVLHLLPLTKCPFPLFEYVIEKKLTISHRTDIAEKMAGANLDRVALSMRWCSYSVFIFYFVIIPTWTSSHLLDIYWAITWISESNDPFLV